jgi:hypothetical protein
MVTNKITREAAQEYFAAWKTEEHYYSLHEEMNSLVEAGFSQPEVFWRKGPMAIYGALKHKI